MAGDVTGFGVLLEGDVRLRRKLERLETKSQKKIVRPAVNAALTPINKAAKRKASVETGLLKKSIGKKVKTYRSGTVWGGVGPRTGFKTQMEDGRFRNPVKYAHLVELGTRHSPARPFLRPALDEQRPHALAVLAAKVRAGIEKEARKP
jgi:HK97 gp10 family phage protein